jgi:hypothetical protein
VAVLPEASVTVHVTVVAPFGYVDGALFEYVAPGQLSDIDGDPSDTCDALRLQTPGSVLYVCADGAVIVGTSVSLIVTV